MRLRLYIPADCVNPRTANLDAQYALSEACPKKIHHHTRRNSHNAYWPTFLSRKGACTDNSPALTLSYHLLCCIFITVESAFHIDRKHRLKVIGCRCGRISAGSEWFTNYNLLSKSGFDLQMPAFATNYDNISSQAELNQTL
jgi:hypothetical protein